MAIQLFAHNEKAYRQAMAMLENCGKAAIVHPTGTGKSYIAFKLIEDHPDERVVWLSPSEYIFKTQTENVQKENPDFPLQNVTFLTYARLMQMDEDEIASLHPTYLIIDEFHRCGAEHWGDGLKRLLAQYPDTKMLGLSATHIRYLDNQRNMADELFEGNIASEMTLGEAVVRGILPAPTYVTTVFRYQNELARYQKRVDSLKSPGIQDINQRYLDALRRALEQAEGLDVVFQKYITNTSGRYIVFCSDYENLKEMRSHTKEWFGAVNETIHTYSAYSSDPATSKAFAKFKKDDSGALKLLFCIDMLNEGIHVKGISGVILFRPTVSPIVYKQQIGRALTAGEGGTPLILDIVNNFEGLSSISTLQQEMTLAACNMVRLGEQDKIVTDHFTVIEQARDCRKLFEQLDQSLSGTWDQYFHAASIYYAEHNNLEVPMRYTTSTGLSLGRWIATQRRVRSGLIPGSLTEQQIARLDSIGMVWGNRLELAWERGFEHARAYYEQYGNLEVPARYECEDGFKLGSWITNQRTDRINGERQQLLNRERVERLDSIGMVWDVLNLKWERNYLAAAQYYQDNGDLLVPSQYVTKEGIKLGTWVASLRKMKESGKLTEAQIQRLEVVGMQWRSRSDYGWQRGFQAAKAYRRQYGDLNVSSTFITPDGYPLGKWVERQRFAFQCPEKANNILTPERKKLLDSIGMVWTKQDPWEYRFELARQYKEEHGDLTIPAKYKTSDGIWLGNWLYHQKKLLAGKERGQQLSEAQKMKLMELGIA